MSNVIKGTNELRKWIEIRINRLEQRLEVKFPHSYRQFLLEKGSAVIDGHKIMGIPTKKVPMSVLEATETLRNKRPDLSKKIITVGIKGTRALCLDLEKAPGEDAPIVEVDLTKIYRYSKTKVANLNNNMEKVMKYGLCSSR